MRSALIAAVLAASALAHAAPPALRRASFDATITAVGPASRFHCGGLMATQALTLKLRPTGDTMTLRVLTCFAGPLLRQIPGERWLYELDPARLHAGSRISVDAEELAPGAWLATSDRISVTN